MLNFSDTKISFYQVYLIVFACFEIKLQHWFMCWSPHLKRKLLVSTENIHFDELHTQLPILEINYKIFGIFAVT